MISKEYIDELHHKFITCEAFIEGSSSSLETKEARVTLEDISKIQKEEYNKLFHDICKKYNINFETHYFDWKGNILKR